VAKDYVDNNEGGGFLFADEDDFEEMTRKANASVTLEEDNEAQMILKAFANEDEEPHTPQPTVTSAPEPKEEESAFSDAFAPIEENQFSYQAPEPPKAQDPVLPTHSQNPLSPDFVAPERKNEPAPELIPQPQYQEPVYEQTSVQNPVETQPVPGGMYDLVHHSQNSHIDQVIPQVNFKKVTPAKPDPEVSFSRVGTLSPEEEMSYIARIVNISKAYNALNDDQKSVVGQFISNVEFNVQDSATFIFKALHVSPVLSKSLTALNKAKKQDPVERAFYIMGLSEEILFALGSLVDLFVEPQINQQLPRIEYARALVEAIEILDPNAVEYIAATESVLSAAFKEEE